MIEQLYAVARECVVRNAVKKASPEAVGPDTRLVEDLGYDSVRAITLLVDLETTLGVSISDEGVNLEHAFQTVDHIYKYIDRVVRAMTAGQSLPKAGHD